MTEFIITCPSELDADGHYRIDRWKELIRCKDCRFLIDHYGFMNDGYCANMRDKYDVKFKPDKNFFCADGERK